MARDSRHDADRIARRTRRVVRGGLQAEARCASAPSTRNSASTSRRPSPVPYDGPRGIRALLEGMQGLLGWEPILEGDNIIGLADPTGGGAISLEPGGQFELSGAPLETVHQTCRELMAHLAQVREVARPLGIGFLGLGMTPKWSRAETPVMPKSRYKIMADYMPKVGRLRPRHDVPHLHRAGEPRLLRRSRHGARSCASGWRCSRSPPRSSPIRRSPRAGRTASSRSAPRSGATPTTHRTGMLPFAFEDGFGFERYVDWALDVPMYFVKRGDRYNDVAGLVPRSSGRQAAALPASAPRCPTGRTTSRRSFPRCGSRATSRCAAPTAGRGGGCRRCRRSGSASSTTRPARRRLGHRQGLDRGGAAGAPRRRAEAGLQGDDPRPQRARHRRGDACARRDRG